MGSAQAIRPAEAEPAAGGPRWSRRAPALAGSIVLLVMVCFASLALGANPSPLSEVWNALFNYTGTGDQINVLDLRLSRTILGLLAGAALALSGAIMQALSRNPLADPGLLGVNAGAALAVVVGISFLGITTLNGYVWLALLGAGAATVIVYALGSAGRAGVSPVRLALAGAAISAVLGGFISAIVLIDLSAFDGFRSWGVGALAGRKMPVVEQVWPFLVLGLVVGLAMARPLNALAMGDETAAALGAKVSRIRVTGVVATTLMCGAATAAIGPIGFVGLVVPHMVRAFTGPDNRWLLPFSAIVGPILLLAADIIGRLVLRPGELETAIVTAFLGAPFFIALVRRRRLMQL